MSDTFTVQSPIYTVVSRNMTGLFFFPLMRIYYMSISANFLTFRNVNKDNHNIVDMVYGLELTKNTGVKLH